MPLYTQKNQKVTTFPDFFRFSRKFIKISTELGKILNNKPCENHFFHRLLATFAKSSYICQVK